MKTHGKKMRFAVCINNTDNSVDLDLYKVYRIIPDKDAEAEGLVRVVDESGEDYLYPQGWFEPIRVSPLLKRKLLQTA